MSLTAAVTCDVALLDQALCKGVITSFLIINVLQTSHVPMKLKWQVNHYFLIDVSIYVKPWRFTYGCSNLYMSVQQIQFVTEAYLLIVAFICSSAC